MNFAHHEIGHQRAGTVVLLGLIGSAANVLLLDSSQYAAYRSGSFQAQSVDGQATQSPAQLRIPHDGWWHVVVEHGQAAGSVRSWVIGGYPMAA